MGHLGELRKRITYVAIVVVVFMIAAFIEKKYVFRVLMYPLQEHRTWTQLHRPSASTEAFMQVLKVSIYAGLICSLPFLLYQFWAFILPGLYENEKRSVIPYVSLTTRPVPGGHRLRLLHRAAHRPPVHDRTTATAMPSSTSMLQAERYISFVSMFELAFGVGVRACPSS